MPMNYQATTNLIGGQPFLLKNLKQVKALIEPRESSWWWMAA